MTGFYLRVGVFLTLLSLGAVYIPRLSNESVCLRFWSGIPSSGIRYSLLDVVSGRNELDTRVPHRLSSISSPDGQWLVYAEEHRDKADYYTVYVQSLADQSLTVIHEDIMPILDQVSASEVFRWFPDSSGFAYFWRQRLGTTTYLSSVNYDGTNQQTIPYIRYNAAEMDSQNTIIQGWSDDGRYMSIAERYVQEMQVSFLTTQPLQKIKSPLDDLRFTHSLWALQGALFVGVTAGRQPTVIFFAPDQDEIVASVQLPAMDVRLLSWSPDGQHLSVVSTILDCENGSPCAKRWRYDIFNQTGDSMTLIGSHLRHGESDGGYLYRRDGITVSTEVVTATWTPDSQNWVYASEQNGVIDLIRFNLDSGDEHLITDLVPDLVHGLFAMNVWGTMAFQSFAPVPPTPLNEKMLIFRPEADSITAELANLDGTNRTVLVQNAASIVPPPSFTLYEVDFWSSTTDWVAITWVDESGQTNLTASRTDSPDHETITLDPHETKSVTWVDDTHMRYFAQNDTLTLVNLESRSVHPLVTQIDTSINWILMLSPTEKNVAIFSSGDPLGRADIPLWLVNLDSSTASKFHLNVLGGPAWSPDGAYFAFSSGESYSNNDIKIIDQTGREVHSSPAPSNDYGLWWLNGWTTCA